MLEVLQKENKILRKVASEVLHTDITTPKIQSILTRMKKTLATQKDGVALAAPQIGVPLRIFIVSGEVFKDPDDEKAPMPADLIFINPKITKLSKKKELINEGCLSVRHWHGKVKRSVKATVRAYDEKGKRLERGGSGLLEQIFQHEMDHLNGILFIDKAKELREVKPETKIAKKVDPDSGQAH